MSEELFITQEIGSFRKPDYLSKKFHKILGHEEYYNLGKKATIETLELFEKSGLENLGVAGEMFRWEMYEHLAANVGGLEFYGMVRSFDNRYYRKGSVVSEVTRKNPFHVDELDFLLNNTKGKLKVPITGPYTMMDWSFNEHYRDRLELANAFADVINHEVRELKKLWDRHRPNEVLEIQIDEPAATTHPDEMDIVTESVNRSFEGISGIEPTIHVCYSVDYRYLYNTLHDLKVKGLNLEYANRDKYSSGTSVEQRPGYADLQAFNEVNQTLSEKKFIGLGVTDIHVDFVEPVDLIRDRIEAAVKLVEDPKLLRINPDCGLRTRSRDIGYQKLKNMNDATKEVRKNY